MDHVNYYAYRVSNDCYWTLLPSALFTFSSSPLLQLCTFSFTNRYRSYRPTRALTPTQATIRPSYR